MHAFRLLRRKKSLLFVPTTLISYVPEALYTLLLFVTVFPAVFHMPIDIAYMISGGILVKGAVEMVIMGFICAALLANKGFIRFVKEFFPHKN